MRIHLDTDFAGDTDDAAALAMLLGWPDAELVGVTTTADPDGCRAGYVRHVLALAGRELSVVSGAGASLAGSSMGGLQDHQRYWGDDAVTAVRSPDGAAVELLATNIDDGAVVVAIGPYTNLAVLEDRRPGTLRGATVVVMGGWVQPPADGLPAWGPDIDRNVQCDTAAAMAVLEATGDLTLVTTPATLRACLRRADLHRLAASGPIGRMLARQGLAHAVDHDMERLGRAHPALPDDLLNFHYDPVACAVALGWSHVTTTTMPLRPRLERDVLRFEQVTGGRHVKVVTDVDGSAFAETWLRAIERADEARELTS